MASARQIAANQANAQHSTGPATEEGKWRSSRNHRVHGCSIRRHVVLPEEDQNDYEDLLSLYKDEHAPSTPTERHLVHRLAEAEWRIQRVNRIEHHLIAKSGLPVEEFYEQHAAELVRFQRYATSHRCEYTRALNDLIKFHRLRLLEADNPHMISGRHYPDPELAAPPEPETAEYTSNPISQNEAIPELDPLPPPPPRGPTPDGEPIVIHGKGKETKPMLTYKVPYEFANELLRLTRLRPGFDPLRNRSHMSESLKTYLKDRNHLAAACQLVRTAC